MYLGTPKNCTESNIVKRKCSKLISTAEIGNKHSETLFLLHIYTYRNCHYEIKSLATVFLNKGKMDGTCNILGFSLQTIGYIKMGFSIEV